MDELCIVRIPAHKTADAISFEMEINADNDQEPNDYGGSQP